MLLVRLSDPAYQTDLIVFLGNSGLESVTRRGADVQVTGLEEDPLSRILETWQSLHPGVTARIVRDDA